MATDRRDPADGHREAVESLGEREHVALVYESDEERESAVARFLHTSLARNSRCLYLIDSPQEGGVLDRLRRAGLDIEGAHRDGRLRLPSYLRGEPGRERFDPNSVCKDLEEALAALESPGESALCVVGDLTVALDNGLSAEDLLHYEADVSALLAGRPVTTLCLFDRRRLQGGTLRAVIYAHATIIVGGRRYDNPYYVPPERITHADRDRWEVDRLLQTLRERKDAEEAIARARDYYLTIVEGFPSLVWRSRPDGTLDHFNAAWLRFTGRPLEQEVGEGWVESVHPDDREACVASYYQAFGARAPYRQEYRLRRHDGVYRWFIDVGRPFYDLDGAFAGYIGTCFDITERKEAEEKLRDTVEVLESLVQSSPIAIINLDLAGRVQLWSPAAERMFGWTAEEVLGKPLPTVPPDGREAFQAFLGALEDGQTFTTVDRVRMRKDGTLLQVALSSAPLRNAAGQIVGMVGLLADVSEQRRSEQERRDLESKIQQTQKLESLGVMAGGIAHDFNNLLTGILGNANMALLELAPLSPAYESVLQIETAARRAADLTSQLLAYSGRGRLQVITLNLAELVREMAHLLEVSVSKKCVLRYDFAPDLPPVEADATQLRQVVMNLIINASEAVGDRPGIVSIGIRAMHCDRGYLATTWIDEELPEGRYVCLEVADTGCGMSPETQKRMFEPFFTTKFTGRGLGLAATLGIVRGHRGAIKIYSETGRGTTVKILLPASAHAAADLDPASPRDKDVEYRGAGLVLVVDDEDAVRRLAKRMLERAGFAVLTASDGMEAVEIFRDHADDIRAVLLDMTMPRMDGEETFREMRRIRADVRVILSSGFSEQDATHRFAGKSLAGFIQKPYVMAQLIAAVRNAVEG